MRLRTLALSAIILIHSDGSMNYPSECCGGQDCAPGQLETIVVPASTGSVVSWVTTKHGVAAVPPNFPRRQSPDGRIHACMRKQSDGSNKLLCLWIPPEA